MSKTVVSVWIVFFHPLLLLNQTLSLLLTGFSFFFFQAEENFADSCSEICLWFALKLLDQLYSVLHCGRRQELVCWWWSLPACRRSRAPSEPARSSIHVTIHPFIKLLEQRPCLTTARKLDQHETKYHHKQAFSGETWYFASYNSDDLYQSWLRVGFSPVCLYKTGSVHKVNSNISATGLFQSFSVRFRPSVTFGHDCSLVVDLSVGVFA